MERMENTYIDLKTPHNFCDFKVFIILVNTSVQGRCVRGNSRFFSSTFLELKKKTISLLSLDL